VVSELLETVKLLLGVVWLYHVTVQGLARLYPFCLSFTAEGRKSDLIVRACVNWFQ
jgi:hypothetical protein